MSSMSTMSTLGAPAGAFTSNRGGAFAFLTSSSVIGGYLGSGMGRTVRSRLSAGASLVAKEDAVPVIVDDALGFTDPDRLAKMGAVFDALGGAGQVIVLTCSPHRYDSVADAHHIKLTA